MRTLLPEINTVEGAAKQIRDWIGDSSVTALARIALVREAGKAINEIAGGIASVRRKMR